MDLATENRIAIMLMKEAAELRRQAEKEGVGAYLGQPKVRGRPNSRFLTATVLGVQQANRAVEVNEMWNMRQKEVNLNNDKKNRRSRDRSSTSCRNFPTSSTLLHYSETRRDSKVCASNNEELYSEEGGLKDEEFEEFLHSRVKRGRGAVGPRMDEAGPYLPLEAKRELSPSPDRWTKEKRKPLLGPEKPSYLKSHLSSENESDTYCGKKVKKRHRVSSKKSYYSSEDESDGSSQKKHRSKKKKRHCSKRSSKRY